MKEEFFRKRGQDFTYKIKGKHVAPNTINYNISIKDIVEGFKRGIVTTTTQLEDLRGPSIYAFRNDGRFKIHYKKISSNRSCISCYLSNKIIYKYY